MPAGKRTDGAFVLGIETATPHGGVAVCGEAGICGEITLRNPRSHSEKLLPAIDTLLDFLEIQAAGLSAIAVSAGPGTFTGLRVGAAAAKGLAFSLSLPLYGISTLDILASGASPRKGPVCAVIDARKGELFWALYSFRRGELVKTRDEGVAAPAELGKKLPPDTLLLGELAARNKVLSTMAKKDAPFHAAEQMNFPRAAAVACRGREMFLAGKPSEIDTFTPAYLRPPDAEKKISGSPRNGGTKKGEKHE